MSALAGIWRFAGGPDLGADCARMLDAQSLYGGYKTDALTQNPVALGRRLARLLPEDVNDDQPLVGGGGRYLLVADLRLDNRDELISMLGADPAAARTMCDAALLLAAFERWGENCCERLVGPFAFAVWDAGERRLLLARDFLGARPLHYHCGPGFLAFASMPKGLHALAEIPRAPNEARVAEFLALAPERGTDSFFIGVERVEPGTVAALSPAGRRVRRHWSGAGGQLKLKRFEDYVEGLRHHLDQAVGAQLRGAEKTAAAHLSAGFDSGAVATTAARLMRPAGGRLVAYTSAPRQGYDLPAPKFAIGDEAPLAAATAALHDNIEHLVIRVGSRSPFETLDRNFFLYDRPVLNLCNNVWMSAICAEARRRRLTVLLTGQMGNMSLSYNGDEHLAELVAQGRLLAWARRAPLVKRRVGLSWKGVLARSFGPWTPAPVWSFLSRAVTGHAHDIGAYSALNPQLAAQMDFAAMARERGYDPAYRPWKDGRAMRLWVLSRTDVGCHYKGALGGWGIDLRDPTADRRLLEYCLSVPSEIFAHEGQPKALARAALNDRMPALVLGQTLKGRQAIDWHEGLANGRAQLQEEVARLENVAPAARALDLARMRRLIEDWPKEGWHRAEIVERYRLALLRGVSAGHFLRRALGSNE